MREYKKDFIEHFGYGMQDYVPSEVSGLPAVDIHHVVFKSQGGTDEIDNLIALTREEHERAHNDIEVNNYLKNLIKKRDENS